MEVTANIYTTPLTVTHNGDTVVLNVQKFTPNPFYVNLLSNLQTTTDFTNKTVLGFYEPYDGGGGEFYWDASNVSEPIPGMIIESDAYLVGRWIRIIKDNTYNLLHFGAKNDGSYDNYDALKACNLYINSKGTGKLIIPRGHYFIDKYATEEELQPDFLFDNLNYFEIEGYGAKISFNGDFIRTTVNVRGIGIWILRSENVVIKGLELNGNNQDTGINGMAEPASYGLKFFSVNNIHLEDLHIHYFAGDGYSFRDYGSTLREACKNVYVLNVISEYNGRQAMTAGQIRGGLFVNCKFNYSGMSAYGEHSPASGVDVEPGRSIDTPPPNAMDVNTGDLTFLDCDFIGNKGSAFLAAYPTMSDTIKLIGCHFDVINETATSGTDGFIIDVPDAIIDNCYFDLRGEKKAYLGWALNSEVDIKVSNSVFKGRAKFVSSLVNNKLSIDNCNFISTAQNPFNDVVVELQNNKALFKNNRVFVPQAAYYRQGSGDRHLIIYLAVNASENNIFETDLVKTYDGNTTAHYAAIYSTANVLHDKFIGTSTGNSDTFRPVINSGWNTTDRYSQGIQNLGYGFMVGANSVTQKHIIAGTAAPTTNYHYEGERIINTDPETNFIYGWICVKKGTPGTWKPLQPILSGTTILRPTTTVIGFRYYDTSLNADIVWDGTVWKTSSSITNTVVTTARTAAELNTSYPSAPEGFEAKYTAITPPTIYKKTSVAGQWMVIVATNLDISI